MYATKKILAILFAAGMMFILFAGSTTAQKLKLLKKIEQIRILESTQNQVAKLLGEPEKSDYPFSKKYRFKEGILTVHYSEGLCSDTDLSYWNVPKLTVTKIFFDVRVKVRFEKLDINFNEFETYHPFDVPKATGFVNNEKGVEYFRKSNGLLEYISFYPTEEQYDRYYCKE
jgi:hypothetical protein